MSEIEVRSLLRLTDGGLVPVEACAERPAGPQYVSGAIELIVDGVQIISVAEWDLVDQLWAYIANMIEELPKSGHTSTYFPDQPVELGFRRTSPGRLLVFCKVNGNLRQVSVDEAEFMAAIRSAGEVFFGEMMRLFPENENLYRVARRKLAL